MSCNATVSSWLNGFDFSLKTMKSLPYEGLLRSLGAPSVGEAYARAFSAKSASIAREVAPPRLLGDDELSKPALRPLAELREYVRRSFSRDELLGFYVHGSYGTMDYVENYSDLDTLVIVRKKVVDDPKWAADFRRRLTRSNTFLFLTDPFQHHHHFTLTEHDLENYLEPIFPLVLFEFAAEITDFRERLPFRVRDHGGALRDALSACGGTFERIWMPMRRLRAYDVKNAVSNILLLPALYLQRKTGQYSYKRFTFEKARPDFDPAVWSIVERATEVRRRCPYASAYPYAFRKSLGMKTHYKALHQLHRLADRDNSAEMLAVLGRDFLRDASALARAMEEKCRADGK